MSKRFRMFSLALIALTLAMGGSVSAARAQDAAPIPALAVSPLAVVDAYMAAWNAHDAVKAADFFADDGVYFDTTVGTPKQGRDAVRQGVISVFMGAAPDLSWTRDAKEPIAGPEGVSFEWTFKGTNTGAWDASTPATNKPFAFKGVSFVRIKNGKIVYQGDYYDALSFQKQLGWIK